MERGYNIQNKKTRLGIKKNELASRIALGGKKHTIKLAFRTVLKTKCPYKPKRKKKNILLTLPMLHRVGSLCHLAWVVLSKARPAASTAMPAHFSVAGVEERDNSRDGHEPGILEKPAAYRTAHYLFQRMFRRAV